MNKKRFYFEIIGTFSICHRLPERSFFFRGRQFPFCSRCTGIIIGYWFYPLFIFHIVNFSLVLILLLHLPMIIDGTTQMFLNRESTNWLRFVTGLMAGISQVACMNFIAEFISRLIYKFMVT